MRSIWDKLIQIFLFIIISSFVILWIYTELLDEEPFSLWALIISLITIVITWNSQYAADILNGLINFLPNKIAMFIRYAALLIYLGGIIVTIITTLSIILGLLDYLSYY